MSVEELRREYEELLMGIRIELQDSEQERRRLLRERNKLRAELTAQRGKEADAHGDREFFDLWVKCCGKAPERTLFGEKRQAVVRAARTAMASHPNGDEEIRNAIRGVGHFPYVVNSQRAPRGKPAERYDELELILRNEVNIEKFAKLVGRHAPTVPERKVHPRGRQFDPVHELSNALASAGCKITGNPHHQDKWVAQCPAHEDRSPSLSVAQKSGKVLLYCHAGCSTKSILEALGLEWCDLFSPDFQSAEIDKLFPPPPPGRKVYDRLGLEW